MIDEGSKVAAHTEDKGSTTKDVTPVAKKLAAAAFNAAAGEEYC